MFPKILVFVPAHVNAIGIHHELTTRLTQCLAPKADVRLATSSDRGVASELKNFDIVHIFGCWSHSAFLIASRAYKEHVPYVITPLGGLQPWEMEHHSYSILFREQQKLVRRALAVQVCGNLEEKTFSKLGWNNRVVLIKNPVLTSLTTFEKVADDLLAVYRKVIDSCARLLLTNEEQHLIGRLLQMGVDSQALSAYASEISESLSSLTEEAWRKIFIYADDEHISGPIAKTVRSLNFSDKVIDATVIDRFCRERFYNDGNLKDDALLSKSLLLRNKVKEVFDAQGKTEQKVCLALLNLHYELGRHTASLMHLADVYQLLRLKDMDEDAVAEMIHRLKLDDFTQRLTAVLAEFLGLTEGFMPFSAKRGRGTKRIYKMITKFGTYV